MALDTLLLGVLADPVDKGPLIWSAADRRLHNPRATIAYPVEDGIPVLLPGRAETLAQSTVEHIGDRAPRQALGAGSQNDTATAASPYDGNAEWYDSAMRDPGVRGSLHDSAFRILEQLVGRGTGIALDIGCGTGIAASLLRDLGYRPIGLDYSADQLRIAHGRLPVAQADAQRLPLASASIPLAVSTFAFGDWADLADSVADLYRALRPGGRFVDITVHPCFNGGFARTQPDGSVLQSAGYGRQAYLAPDHFGSTIRSRVGAWHRPLYAIVNTFLSVGFQLNRVIEDGPGDLPSILALSFVKP
jgi:SAM-dependent methyltransferase/uncharacterized protein YbaR (Trm112 family)